MVAQLYKYTKIHTIGHFKWINCMLCELYFNKINKYIVKRRKKKRTLMFGNILVFFLCALKKLFEGECWEEKKIDLWCV